MIMDMVEEIIKRPGCRIIRLQSGDKLTVPYALFKTKPLAAGKPIDPVAYLQALAPIEGKCALEQAARLLGLRDRASAEIVKKLQGQGYSLVAVQAAIDRLTKAGLLEDRRFALDYIKRNGRKRGAGRIRFELTQKGVANELIDELMQERDEDEELNAAIKLAEKQFSKRYDDIRVQYQRSFAALARRGFSPDVVRKALEAVRTGQENFSLLAEDDE